MAPRTAALLLLLTAVGGQVLLRWRAAHRPASGVVVTGIRNEGSAATQRTRAGAQTAEVAAGERVDVDRANAAELARLPGVGPALAKRIVEERGRGGPFGGRECLDRRVAGIGEGFFRRAGEHLAFSGGACDGAVGRDGGEGGGPRTAGRAEGCPEIVDINRADRGELECLPGIGPARAESILAVRERRGGFGSVEALRGVPGVTAGVLEGLRRGVVAGQVP
jgi:competence ComEA-like helix-hairpin-helix protein